MSRDDLILVRAIGTRWYVLYAYASRDAEDEEFFLHGTDYPDRDSALRAAHDEDREWGWTEYGVRESAPSPQPNPRDQEDWIRQRPTWEDA
jgi:hypothetical protein